MAVVAIFIFSLLGRPDIQWAILSRILLIPVIAGMSYEVIRFSGLHQGNLISNIVAAPGMALQRLTTRRPDDDQIEVAIEAMNAALEADEGREAASTTDREEDRVLASRNPCTATECATLPTRITPIPVSSTGQALTFPRQGGRDIAAWSGRFSNRPYGGMGKGLRGTG